MERPLDYSIDRFYLVSNETLGLTGDTKYLYNSSTADVYPITEETSMTVGRIARRAGISAEAVGGRSR